MTIKTKARLEARVNSEVKLLLQKAADLEGRSLTDFIISSVQSAAYEVIEKHRSLRLSLEDSDLFIDALHNPPEPNQELKLAAKRYSQTMRTE
jgi:uncharacterized protein (DUF1778 family)